MKRLSEAVRRPIGVLNEEEPSVEERLSRGSGARNEKREVVQHICTSLERRCERVREYIRAGILESSEGENRRPSSSISDLFGRCDYDGEHVGERDAGAVAAKNFNIDLCCLPAESRM